MLARGPPNKSNVQKSMAVTKPSKPLISVDVFQEEVSDEEDVFKPKQPKLGLLKPSIKKESRRRSSKFDVDNFDF